MKRLHNLRARSKFFIAYALFVLPVVFLFYVVIDKTLADIGFAQKERLGTSYVVVLRQMQDAVLNNDTSLPSPQLAAQVLAAEQEFGQDMGTADLAKAAAAALKAPPDPTRQQARSALHDLIGKVTDGSNLTLDPDLDSFYVMDATTGKIVDALDRFYGIAAVTASYAGKPVLTPAEQADFLVQDGSIGPVLDGLDADLTTAFAATDRVRLALAEPLKTAQGATKQALATLRTIALDSRSDAARAPAVIAPALAALSSLCAQSATELSRLLTARITGFRNTLLVDLAIATVLFAAGIGFVLVAIQAGVVRPLGRITGLMQSLSTGNLQVEVPESSRRDEIGKMIQAVAVFKQNALENERLTAATARDQAAKDRRQAAMDTHIQDFGGSVAGVMASLEKSAGKMHAAANEMSAAATRTRDSTSGAVDGANASARDLNSVAVAAEQMTASIHEISRQVTHVTEAVGQAVDRASQTDKKVASLADTADRIGEVVRLITDIAGQTNLLALNATIEAARAGEAGKGFAVVASEVKTLATQTARATDQIGAQIVAIRSATAEAVEAVRDVGSAIGQVAAVAAAIAAAVEQQAAATQEISSSVQNVTAATNGSAEAMEQVLTIAEQTDTASRSVLLAAEDVGQTAGTLHVEVNDFLTAMQRGDGDGDERRAYERVPGAGATASMTIQGHTEIQAVVKDISRGGVALLSNNTAPAGTQVQVSLPAGATVAGRIVRATNGLVTISFRQEGSNLALLDRAVDAIKQKARAAAA